MPRQVKLGEVLVSEGIITRGQLEEALKAQKERGGFLGQIFIEKRFASSGDIARALQSITKKTDENEELGKALLDNKVITEDQLKKARDVQSKKSKNLASALVELKFVAPDEITRTLGKYWNINYISLADYQPKQELMQLIPEDVMRSHQLIPVKLESDTLTVAMADPLDIMAVDEVRLLTNRQIDIMISTEKDISFLLNKYFTIQKSMKEVLLGTKLEEIGRSLAKEEAGIDVLTHRLAEGPIIKLVDTIIEGGINGKASDIHLEPQEPDMRVRYRVDGILHDIMNIPRMTRGAVVSRVKVLADMDIAERRRPQDGHIALRKKGKQYDLRVSSFATVGGEKIVIRILDKSSMLLGLNELGLSKKDQGVFQSLINMPYGIILVTGPTGAGKTTTLYAVLSQLNSPTKNIITVEDPVEYKLEGINQSQVNPQAGITFASGLRSILRQDPDIIMVGEIRDLETAKIAIQASMTGHLVLSTLHTNDAPSAVTRLMDMGVEPYLISSSVIGVLAERLVRTICSDCKESYSPEPGVAGSLGLTQSKKYDFTKGKGCQYCLNTGYRGRIGIFELMRVTDSIRSLISQRKDLDAIRETAIKEGMDTLRQSAVEKVMEGITTPEEVKRVIFAEEK